MCCKERQSRGGGIRKNRGKTPRTGVASAHDFLDVLKEVIQKQKGGNRRPEKKNGYYGEVFEGLGRPEIRSN